jgi:polyphenol oxidase
MTPVVARTPRRGAQVTLPVVSGFDWRTTAAGPILQSAKLLPLANHVVTTRHLQFRGPTASDDLGLLAQALDVLPADVITVRQIHGRRIHVVRPGEPLSEPPEADAIISFDRDRVIAVKVADCVPILMADRRGRAVAAVHAGWRGTCAAIAAATVDALGETGIAAEDLVVAIGPSVGPCCYQVEDRVRTAFLAMTPDAAAWFTEDGPGHWRLDLWQANLDQLEAAGVPGAQIALARSCTSDEAAVWFSYRREGPATGRLVAAIR